MSESEPNEEVNENQDDEEINEQLSDEASEETVPESYEELTDRHLKEIGYKLGLITLHWPEIEDSELRNHYPVSYIQNSGKEKLLLWYAENFRRQFCLKYKDRKPLLLAAENECGLQKMVCSTIRTTHLPYPELSSWEGCAHFVSDHLQYEPLESPTSLPQHLNSPTAVLETQVGHSFEYSTLLCSLLIGVGYSAYVVSGYATREYCLNDRTRITCPKLIKPPPPVPEEIIEEVSKYQLKPPPDLESQFLREMSRREQERLIEEERKRQEEIQKAIEEFEKPPPDDLHGSRLHSWVLILPPKKEVTEPFFIEAVTGNRQEIHDTCYLGIESVWDDTNYWVNIQDCSEGCKDMSFELNDCNKWCRLLVGEPWHVRHEIGERDDDPYHALQEKHIDIPPSWVNKIEISGIEHFYYKMNTTVEDEHEIQFYDVARFDHLEKIEMHPEYLKEYFKDREDLLYFRGVVFETPDPSENGASKEVKRTVKKITEKYYRNPKKAPSEDVAERVFSVSENLVRILYFHGLNQITGATREFIKPPLSERGEHLTFKPELSTCYQFDTTAPQPKQLELFYLLDEMLKREEKLLFHIRKIESEVSEILHTRAIETCTPSLYITLFDRERNWEAKQCMKEKDQKKLEKQIKEVEAEADYLAPFLARIGNPEKLTRQQALQLREECLSDYKQLLVDRATNIQTIFLKEMQVLQARHRWNQEERDNLTKEQEEEYFDYVNKTNFYLHCLELRLNRIRETAPAKYLSMEAYLREDKRLSILQK